MIEHVGDIWCDQHGCIHDVSTNPYDGCPTETDKDGNPVWLMHVDLDEDGNETSGGYYEKPMVKEVLRPIPPDCTPDVWRVLWVGKRFK